MYSSVHDGDIVPMLAALDLFPSSEHLPISHRPTSRNWRMSQVVPMNGRVIFEYLECDDPRLALSDGGRQIPPPPLEKRGEDRRSTFIRININDGIVAIPDCTSGPGSSCPLEDFLALVRRRGEEIGDFKELCGLGADDADRITFLRQ